MKKMLMIIAVVAGIAVIAAMVAVNMQLTGALSGVPARVSVGDAMPDFSLQDYNGQTHTLAQYAGSIVVLDFCSHKCPFSLGTDPDLAVLARDYEKNPKVVFLGIDSHHDTTAEEIKAYAEANNLPYPILRDPDNRYADAAGALVTPDIFIVDDKGMLAYRGAFDNRIRPDSKGSRAYVADAIAALLAGEEVKPNHVSAWGCTIKRAQ